MDSDKVRAQLIETGEWEYFILGDVIEIEGEEKDRILHEYDNWSEYIDLNDVDGKEIYFDDILSDGSGYTYIVCRTQDWKSHELLCRENNLKSGVLTEDKIEAWRLRVIGNAYEPETDG